MTKSSKLKLGTLFLLLSVSAGTLKAFNLLQPMYVVLGVMAAIIYIIIGIIISALSYERLAADDMHPLCGILWPATLIVVIVFFGCKWLFGEWGTELFNKSKNFFRER